MKKAILILLSILLPLEISLAQSAPKPARAKAAAGGTRELQVALDLARRGEYVAASIRLFNMTRNPKFRNERVRIKYILGLMLFEMKLYQTAAFQFVDVIRKNDPQYLKQSLRKLSVAADRLDDDTLLNYAISKVSLNEFPPNSQDMLRFRIGEFHLRKENYKEAIVNLSMVPRTSTYYYKAKYLEALAYVKSNDLDSGIKSYKELLSASEKLGVNSNERVGALLGLARTYYQRKNWDTAIELYRRVPRDNEMWHDSLFEISWAHIRGAQFRSVLSSLHSLHSSYYEDFYLPESILLRGIVYLYICRYDEMEKTLALFEKLYLPVFNGLGQFLKVNTDPGVYFQELEKVVYNFEELKSKKSSRSGYQIPFLAARNILKEGDFKRSYAYIQKLRKENEIIKGLPVQWQRSPIGQYSKRIIDGRLTTSTRVVGTIVRNHMLTMRRDLYENFQQYDFGRYEMLSGKQEAQKKKIAGKGLEAGQVDEEKSRDFYIQNGYEYWPFDGEYWLDEIGNYHYLGTQGCE